SPRARQGETKCGPVAYPETGHADDAGRAEARRTREERTRDTAAAHPGFFSAAFGSADFSPAAFVSAGFSSPDAFPSASPCAAAFCASDGIEAGTSKSN